MEFTGASTMTRSGLRNQRLDGTHKCRSIVTSFRGRTKRTFFTTETVSENPVLVMRSWRNRPSMSTSRSKRNIRDLAILGGEAAFKHPLYVGRPNIGNRERLLDRIND